VGGGGGPPLWAKIIGENKGRGGGSHAMDKRVIFGKNSKSCPEGRSIPLLEGLSAFPWGLCWGKTIYFRRVSRGNHFLGKKRRTNLCKKGPNYGRVRKVNIVHMGEGPRYLIIYQKTKYNCGNARKKVSSIIGKISD